MTITTSAIAQNGQANTTKKTFSRETTVSIVIQADAAIIWSLLTNASDFPRWNSTIISIDGEIKEGEKIRLKSTLDEKRTFKLKVKDIQPEKGMIWKGGMGKRRFALTSQSNDSVLFEMTEKIGGPMFPLFAKMVPSFDASFEQFAADLKKEAEIIKNANN